MIEHRIKITDEKFDVEKCRESGYAPAQCQHQ